MRQKRINSTPNNSLTRIFKRYHFLIISPLEFWVIDHQTSGHFDSLCRDMEEDSCSSAVHLSGTLGLLLLLLFLVVVLGIKLRVLFLLV